MNAAAGRNEPLRALETGGAADLPVAGRASSTASTPRSAAATASRSSAAHAIGKSSLLLTLQQQLEGSGRKVRYLNGQGPEGETETTFVAKAIGRPAPAVSSYQPSATANRSSQRAAGSRPWKGSLATGAC